MTLTKLTLSALSVALLCSTAQAEAIGGQIKLSQSAFVDDTAVAKTNFSGAVELGFGPRLGAQLDLGVNAFNASGETATNFAAHGIYKPSDTTAFGAFYGLDSLSGENQSFYGIEAAKNFKSGGVQAYFARGEDSGFSGSVIGLSGGTIIGEGFGLGASVDHGSFEGGLSVTRFGVRASYGQGERSKMFVEIGTLNGEISGLGSDSENYAKVGATYNFGRNSGLTFGDRSIFNLLPGL